MSRKTNENVTINAAMVEAITKAVTASVLQALASTPEVEPVAETKAASPKKSTRGKASKPETIGAGCAGYIEKSGKKVYIARIDRNGNKWIAKLDKKGAPVVGADGKIETLYDGEQYAKAKAKAIKAGKYNPKKRGDLYKSLGWTITGKVSPLS